jgi:hypothetical protein
LQPHKVDALYPRARPFVRGQRLCSRAQTPIAFKMNA